MSRQAPKAELPAGRGKLSEEQLIAIHMAEKCAVEIWEGFQFLGKDFEAWLLLAVSGVLLEKVATGSNEEATIAEVADIIIDSEVLELLHLSSVPDREYLIAALYVLRENPHIVPDARREYLFLASQRRNLAGARTSEHQQEAAAARWEDGRIEDRIGGIDAVRKILAQTEAWHPDGRANIPFIQAQLREPLQREISDKSITNWLRRVAKRSELAEVMQKDVRVKWNEDTEKKLLQISEERDAEAGKTLAGLEYISRRFFEATGKKLTPVNIRLRLWLLRHR